MAYLKKKLVYSHYQINAAKHIQPPQTDVGLQPAALFQDGFSLHYHSICIQVRSLFSGIRIQLSNYVHMW